MISTRARTGVVAAAVLLFGGCTGSSIKTDYILAEKLWQEGSYQPAARQFERIFQKDQKGALGQQALYRAAMTQFLFLKDYAEALRLFQAYLNVAGGGPAARDAQIQIGEIYYSKTGQYEKAIQHYQKWLKENPSAAEAPGFLFRIGRAQFFLWQFEEAIKTFETVLAQTPPPTLAAEAAYQIGMCHLSIAAQSRSSASEGSNDDGSAEIPDSAARHRFAVEAFESVEKRHPGTDAARQSALGIVTSLEERGLWEEALKKLQEMGGKYPIPQILQIRTHRIQERMAKRMTGARR